MSQFKEMMGFNPCGIRMHYVRFDDTTFPKLSKIGYVFDATEFDKTTRGTRKNPYKVGNMWEFPLSIMDSYLSYNILEAKEQTLEILKECKEKELKYISVLFHDYQFCDDYKEIRDWYIWLMELFSKSPIYRFVSYDEAIMEMERAEGKNKER